MTTRAMRTPLLALSTLALLSAGLPAQLRHGIADARHVVVATHVGVRPLGNDFFVHSYRTVESLKGDVPPEFSIVERKRVADLPQPTPGPDRILCLIPDRGAADFPERFGPYLTRTGYRGDDPVADDSAASGSIRELIRVLIESEAGRATARTAADLTALARSGAGQARLEASETVRERPVLRDATSPIERDRLLLAAVGESDDVELKVSLASLCAEAGQKGVVEAMCITLQSVDDPRLASAVEQLVEIEEVGSLTVKGLQKPVPALNVIAIKAGA